MAKTLSSTSPNVPDEHFHQEWHGENGQTWTWDTQEPIWKHVAPQPEPLRDFSVMMPNLVTQEVDLFGLPHQIKVALHFLWSVCPGDIVRDADVADLPPLLPPMREEHRGRRTIVLDLDETLVHCHQTPLQQSPPPALLIRIEVANSPLNAHVYVRPFAQIVLGILAQVFEVVVFTASAAIYADQVLDFLDPTGMWVAHRLYRQHCTEISGGHFKDMRRLGRRLEDIVLVDNSPVAIGLTPDNGILVSSWFGNDYEDAELLKLLQVLDQCAVHGSMPQYLASRYGFSEFLDRLRAQVMQHNSAPTQS